jgi:hypothetical protein
MKPLDVHLYLAGGDRRSVGRANGLVKILERQPNLLPEVVREMWSPDPVVAMRAADAVEKVSRKQAGALRRFKKELLGLAAETQQQELRWHLAAIVPRLQLSPAERRQAATTISRYLEDKSSIVKTFALQGLFDLSLCDSGSRERIEQLLRWAQLNGTPAMRARSRRLLSQMAKERRERKPTTEARKHGVPRRKITEEGRAE